MKTTTLLAVIFGISMASFIVGWALSVACVSKEKKCIKDKIASDTYLAKAYHRLGAWFTATILWTITEYLFVIVPFVSNVIVIYSTDVENLTNNTPAILVFSIISLSFIVFGFSINPQRHKKCYRRAFTYIDSCINEYLVNPNPNILKKGIEGGEGFINPSSDIE